MLATANDTVIALLSKAFSHVFLNEQDKSRILYVHPSSLPFCGFSFLLNYAKYGVYRKQQMESDLILNTGTVFHSILERYISNMEGTRLYGVWHCNSCDNNFTGLTPLTRDGDMICPNCHAYNNLTYNELSINYKRFKGHIDTVLYTKDKEYWILDYKTTTENKAQKKAKDPGEQYLTQILAYAYLIKKQYGINIARVCLVFICRDNPKVETTAVFSMPVTEEKLRETALKLQKYSRIKNTLLHAKTIAELKKAGLQKCSNPWCSACSKHSIPEMWKIIQDSHPALPIADYCK